MLNVCQEISGVSMGSRILSRHAHVAKEENVCIEVLTGRDERI
jgi:hypothetical protein